VGGLYDGDLSLPRVPVVALAGGNGTGKSKLLAAILSPWSGTVPSARPGKEGTVEVQLELTNYERNAMQDFSALIGWGETTVPESITVTTSQHPSVGFRRDGVPSSAVVMHGLLNQQMMQATPSLNIVYLPAERRLVAPSGQGIDLNQLSEEMAWQKTAETRGAVQNYGRLDDQEFESFAKALCVAAALPSESGEAIGVGRRKWLEFQETVNSIIAPKQLLPLVQEYPEHLRIQTPSGDQHLVQELSSGERQALIIMSRVMRAGSRHSVVLIDEPDAYLHPHLSQRLIEALIKAVGDEGQLIVATHSPSILDSLPPTSIIRLSHDEAPHVVLGEGERLELYRSAGFRASALTQSDLLMVVEGEYDAPLLNLLLPQLTRASLRHAGGRARVFREVEQLHPHGMPILGVVDRDVLADPPSKEIKDSISVWPTADIEGLFLSDPIALQLMVDRGLTKANYRDVPSLERVLNSLVEEQRENVIAEIAQRKLRRVNWDWPSPKGSDAVDRLRTAVNSQQTVSQEQLEVALTEAENLWDGLTPQSKWTVVRGKYVLNQFVSEATEMKSGRALLDALARDRPALVGLTELRTRIEAILG